LLFLILEGIYPSLVFRGLAFGFVGSLERATSAGALAPCVQFFTPPFVV